jgi:hypothetical protein
VSGLHGCLQLTACRTVSCGYPAYSSDHRELLLTNILSPAHPILIPPVNAPVNAPPVKLEESPSFSALFANPVGGRPGQASPPSELPNLLGVANENQRSNLRTSAEHIESVNESVSNLQTTKVQSAARTYPHASHILKVT